MRRPLMTKSLGIRFSGVDGIRRLFSGAGPSRDWNWGSLTVVLEKTTTMRDSAPESDDKQ